MDWYIDVVGYISLAITVVAALLFLMLFGII